MTKDEVLNSTKLFLEINGQDKRLVTSLQKALEAMFSDNKTSIPFESLSIAELKERKNRLERAQTNPYIAGDSQEYVKKSILKIDRRIKDLS